MALEAYIPTQVEFAGRPLPDVTLVTLYHPDGTSPAGSLTASQPPGEAANGPLVFTGRRDGKEWRVTLPVIRVTHKTALGCEYTIEGRVQREMLGELTDARKGPHSKGLEERFDIR